MYAPKKTTKKDCIQALESLIKHLKDSSTELHKFNFSVINGTRLVPTQFIFKKEFDGFRTITIDLITENTENK